MISYEAVALKIQEIEAELKRLGRWMPESPPPEAFENMGPFGMNTMAPEQWLQFVLIPRVNEIIAAKGEFPAADSIAAYFVKNLDGDEQAGPLCRLIIEFNSLFDENP